MPGVNSQDNRTEPKKGEGPAEAHDHRTTIYYKFALLASRLGLVIQRLMAAASGSKSKYIQTG